ncbi:hypothetical protein SAMN05660742_111155 [Propionispira arboris]|uniref:Response regulator receiver domain-containing protein n=1 Tax=Propionispira arboris TaxID=84035 RepID=A0A1H7A879_9FIRM|nr:response regulator transcription factor [Propionispira arboris]SEJ60674.1 hypothetical protein SAMN05660742_111155 [Propionispira arboris]
MKILYIEDELDKANQVKMAITNYLNDVDVCIKMSYTTGIIAIKKNCYDVILIDMSLPLYDVKYDSDEDNDFETFAGIDIMKEMDRIGNKTAVIVITAFDVLGKNDKQVNIKQLDKDIKNEFGNQYLGIVQYDSSSLEWHQILINYIKKVHDENITSR